MGGRSHQLTDAREALESPSAALPPSRWQLLRAWFAIGAQSFGGGSATLLLIRRSIVERHRWVTDDEVTRAWAICQIPPGINLLALTTLLGWRLGGAWGVAAALAGLLLPSVTLTILLTAAYRSVQELALVQAALRGIVPATIGLGVLMSWQLARPLLLASRREGRRSLLLSVVLFAAAGVLVVIWNVPIVLALAGSGLSGALGFEWLRRRAGAGA